MERYIGLDVHAKSSTFAVVSEKGKRLSSAVVETNGQSLVQYLKTIAGRRHLCIEEGVQSQWLYEILSPHVDEMVVTHITESRGQKDDLRDALKRAEELRVGSVHPVFKDVRGLGKLRSLADVYTKVSADRVRVQLRLKALYRGRGVPTPDKTVYTFTHREHWMKMLPVAYRPSAELMYAQLDALGEVKKEARKLLVHESHTHAISRVLETVPGLGEVRVAQLIAVVISPYRFRTARQLWSYSGLGVVMRSTSDWVKTPHGWERSNTVKTRGLNRTFNRHLKKIFKGAATTVITGRISPLYEDYVKQTEQGTKPPMAKLTLARRIAATTLAVYKSKEEYDPDKHGKKT